MCKKHNKQNIRKTKNLKRFCTFANVSDHCNNKKNNKNNARNLAHQCMQIITIPKETNSNSVYACLYVAKAIFCIRYIFRIITFVRRIYCSEKILFFPRYIIYIYIKRSKSDFPDSLSD